ncbi:hypothetical protein MKX03_008473, partial [Papaver bracteatum]
ILALRAAETNMSPLKESSMGFFIFYFLDLYISVVFSSFFDGIVNGCVLEVAAELEIKKLHTLLMENNTTFEMNEIPLPPWRPDL